jgi:hypothetical protein
VILLILNLGSALICMRRDGFGFAKSNHASVGTNIFASLYPSLAAVVMKFENIHEKLLSLKFNQN